MLRHERGRRDPRRPPGGRHRVHGHLHEALRPCLPVRRAARPRDARPPGDRDHRAPSLRGEPDRASRHPALPRRPRAAAGAPPGGPGPAHPGGHRPVHAARAAGVRRQSPVDPRPRRQCPPGAVRGSRRGAVHGRVGRRREHAHGSALSVGRARDHRAPLPARSRELPGDGGLLREGGPGAARLPVAVLPEHADRDRRGVDGGWQGRREARHRLAEGGVQGGAPALCRVRAHGRPPITTPEEARGDVALLHKIFHAIKRPLA